MLHIYYIFSCAFLLNLNIMDQNTVDERFDKLSFLTSTGLTPWLVVALMVV